ncbi:hypothetical protein JWJ90_02950 [Desulfobulbus rhabdoformis]|uniref:hypothetical protein n=1 Tax=Desulfobulbus rhabdoformis TaxID=34032 RepID=UPI0019664D38|nr:hypothetical protein [Desulfobulbus rhabdoformis]MBM9613238.1 hypothetical protein [Desulfobulbus rhabdoformis]
MGGLPKKASLVRGLMRDPNRPALLVSSGNMLLNKNFTASEQTAARIRAKAMVRAHQTMGGRVMGLGTLDLSGGVSLLSALHRPPESTLLSANLLNRKSRAPLFSPYTMQKVGDLQVFLIGLTDHKAMPPDRQLSMSSWKETLPELLVQLEKKADILLLLSNYPMTDNMAIARSFPAIDCIFQAGHVTGNKAPIKIGNTLISQTDIRGKFIGVLDIEWHGHSIWQNKESAGTANKGNMYSNRFMAIKDSMRDDPLVANIIKQAKRRMIKAQAQPQAR